MKTKKEVLSENPQYKRLINAVLSRINEENIEDVNNHGISGGFGGFIYYSDTLKFFKQYKKDILKLAEDLSQQLGESDMLGMIQSFNCLSSGDYKNHPNHFTTIPTVSTSKSFTLLVKNRKPNYTQTEIAQAIFNGRGEAVTQVQNAMAWFAAEEVCRMFDN